MDNVGLFFKVFNLSGKDLNLDTWMIFGSEYVIILMIILAIVLAIRGSAKEKRAFILMILSFPVAFLLVKIIHLFFFEPRPFVAYHFYPLVDNIPDASFPSRHALIASVIALGLTYYKSKWAPFFLLLMLWIGFSRIYVGVHYPLDILGGFLIGLISLWLILKIKYWLFRRAF